MSVLFETELFETDDHQRLCQQVRDFAVQQVAPRVTRMESAAAVDTALPALIAEKGWIGLTTARPSPRPRGPRGATGLAPAANHPSLRLQGGARAPAPRARIVGADGLPAPRNGNRA
jgi:acyl-CoA dehydrogenase